MQTLTSSDPAVTNPEDEDESSARSSRVDDQEEDGEIIESEDSLN